MLEKQTKLITKDYDKIKPHLIESYLNLGGYEILKKIVQEEKDPNELLEKIKQAGLRGRGGAGFPTGNKIEFAKKFAKEKNQTPYLVVNADESQPGTFKDRYIIDHNPHSLIEGAMIEAYILRAKKVYIYINPNYLEQYKILENTIKTAEDRGFIGKNIFGSRTDIKIYLRLGAGGYIFGEETTLIGSLEGRRGEPRLRPPFPVSHGYLDHPTVVNNVETVVNITIILNLGPEEYRKFGTKNSPGTKLYSVSGSVQAPGVYEAPLGISIRELVHEISGGMKKGKVLDFVQVGRMGGFYKGKTLDFKISYDCTGKNDVNVGLGDVLVVDKASDFEELLISWSTFFKRESCGQCTPCREGTYHLYKIAERIQENKLTAKDYDNLKRLIEVLEKTTICPFGCFVANMWKGVIDLKGKNYFLKNKKN
ncbi:MAG: NADH-quinone oxidoreductase subunit F [Candidatus Moranbacteria bacterium]|nr:NADH-quinone oxidoreductase subunit F [Candidatus Moranbacteria bacterium]